MIVTKNIGLCAYLKLRGCKIVQVDKVSRGKAEYTFEINQSEYEVYKINYEQSEYKLFYDQLSSVKELSY